MEDLKVSVFQVCSSDSFEDNAGRILNLLSQHAPGTDFCVFPENALYIEVTKKVKVPEIDLYNSFFKEAAKIAQKNNCFLHLGSVPLKKGEKFLNTTVCIDTEGKLTTPYDKIHLYKASLGDLNINEENTFIAGAKPSVIDVKGWKIGLSICFDIRFSELYLHYAKKGCELIVIPSAFFRKTGRAHWEVLNRARAIESQCYIVSPGQVDVHKSVDGKSTRKSYGHSLVVDPWGEVLMDLEEKIDEASTVTLSKDKIAEAKKTVTMERKI